MPDQAVGQGVGVHRERPVGDGRAHRGQPGGEGGRDGVRAGERLDAVADRGGHPQLVGAVHHDRGAGEPLGALRRGGQGGGEPEAHHHEQGDAEREGDERTGQGRPPGPQAAQRHGQHGTAPIRVIRPAIVSADGASSVPSRRPSARKTTRSAREAATGSWVTITIVCPSWSTRSRSSRST